MLETRPQSEASRLGLIFLATLLGVVNPISTILLGLGGGPVYGASPLAADVVFVKATFQGTRGRYYQRPFESEPDTRSNLYKFTSAGALVQLTDLARYEGGVLDPTVSWDGTKILFSMRQHRWEGWHIWEMNADGTGLRQVTFDPPGKKVNDLDPTYLSTPGTFAFVSDRRAGLDESGKGGVGNLFIGSLEAGQVLQIGFNPSGEAGPTLDHEGKLIFARWENLRDNNRGSVWECNQDGTQTLARWGQYGTPAGALVAGYDLQPISGGGNPAYVGLFTAFENLPGDLGVFPMTDFIRDPEKNPVRFPRDGKYLSPAVVNGDSLLYAFDPKEPEGQSNRDDFGIYLDSIDGDARVVVFNATETHEFDPVAIRSSTPPPATAGTWNAIDSNGLFVCSDVTLRGDCRQPCALTPGMADPVLPQHLALGTTDKVRVFRSMPRRGEGLDVSLRGPDLDPDYENESILGEAPVAADGSIALQVPAGEPFAFQTLGPDGAAIAQEKSWLATQRGETVSCLGCHIPRNGAEFENRNSGEPAALLAPTLLTGNGNRSRTYLAGIDDLFLAKCSSCHGGGAPSGGLDLTQGVASYQALVEADFGRVPNRYATENSARNSFLFQLLTGDAYGQSDHQSVIDAINGAVNHTSLLTPEERRSVAEWLDTGAVFAFLPNGLKPGDPEVRATAPVYGTVGVSPNHVYEILFTEPIDPTQALAGSLAVTRTSDSGGIAGSISFPAPDVLRFTAAGGFAPNTAYTVSLATAVQDLEGNFMEQPFTGIFTTGEGADTTAPTFSWAVPNGTLGNLPVTGPILLGFSEPLSAGTLTPNRFRLLDSRGEERPFHLTPSWDTRSVTLVPFPSLEPGATFEVIADPGISDLALNPIGTPVVVQFKTPASLPASALTLKEEAYNTGTYDFDGQDLFFTQDDLWTVLMDWERSRLRWFWNLNPTITSSIQIADRPISMVRNAAGTRAYIVTRDSQKLLILDVTSRSVIETIDLPTSRALEVQLSPDETKALIVTREPTLLMVVDVNPSSGTFKQILGQAEGATHDRARTWLSVHPDGFRNYVTGSRGLDLFEIHAGVPYRVRRKLNDTHLGDSILTKNGLQMYIVNRSRNAVSVFDPATETVVGEIPLDFKPEWPWEVADDRLALSPDERWLVVSQENRGTVWVVDRLTLEVVDHIDLGQPITAVRTRPKGNGWEIHVLLRFQYRDRSRWLILNGPVGLDGAAPTLSSSDPAAGSAGVALNRTLTLRFSEQMDRHSLSEENVTVACNTCSISDVTLDIEIDRDNRVAHLIAEGTWPIQANLTVSLSDQVRDWTGQPLAQPVQFSFNTAGNTPPPYISLVSDFAEVGTDANRLAVDPEGRFILTTDYYGRDLFVHDQQTFEYIDRLDVGDGAYEVFCPPGRNKAYVTNHREHTISVVDLGSLQVVNTIPVDANPNQMALSRDGGSFYVVCSASDSLVQIGLTNDQVIGRLAPSEDFDLESVVSSPVRDWVIGGWNRLHVFGSDSAGVYNVPNGDGARIMQMLVSADGYHLLFRDQYRSTLYNMDTVTWKRTDSFPAPTTPSDIVESPDGRHLLVAHREEGLIRICDRFTTEVVGTIEDVGDVRDQAFSPDGRRLFVLSRGNPGHVLVYQFADPSDLTQPWVEATDPWDGATVVPANTVARVVFNEPVDRNTLNPETLWVAGGTISPVHSEILVSRDNRTAYLVPEIPFELDTPFTLNVTQAVRDLNGKTLVAPVSSDFRTAALANPSPALVFSATSGVVGSPYYITSLTDGDPVLVSNYYANAVTLHDPETLAQGFSINREKRTGKALAFDANRAWVNYPENREIALVNVTNGVVQDPIEYGMDRRDEAISADRSRLAIAMGGDPAFLFVMDLDPSGSATTRQIRIWNWPRTVSLSPDGKYAYVGIYNDILYVNLDTEVIERRISASNIQSTWISHDGRTLYVFENDRERVRVVDIETGQTLTRWPIDKGNWNFALSPDSSIAAVMTRETGSIQFFDAWTNQPFQEYLHPEGQTLRALSFSPDGDHLYFTWDSNNNDGVTSLEVLRKRTGPPPSPTPTNTPNVAPTATPLPGGTETPLNQFDVVHYGQVDEHDLLKLIDMGVMQGGGDGEPMLFMFSLHWFE